jgi:hypothetical protein
MYDSLFFLQGSSHGVRGRTSLQRVGLDWPKSPSSIRGERRPSSNLEIRTLMRRRLSSEADGSEGNYMLESDNILESSPLRASPNCRPTAGVRFHRHFYFLHSSIIFVTVILGMIHNGGNRKYIPVKPAELLKLLSVRFNASPGSIDVTKMGSCSKGFINVHSSTIDEDLAAICCSGTDDSSDFSNDRWYHSNLCHPRIPVMGVPMRQLPFAGRLTRLLEAWVLPLLPILIRLMYQLVFPERTEVNSSTLSAAAHSQISANRLFRTTLQRLLFYVLLLNLRGFGLYIGANALEEYALRTWFSGYKSVSQSSTNSMRDAEHDLNNSGGQSGCWYEEALKPHQKLAMKNDQHSECYGRQFDFSDHVVLFLTNYLVIFVAEILIIYSIPFWDTKTTDRIQVKQRQSGLFLPKGAMWNTILASLFLYLHILVCHALYQTAAYFHTPAEILVGYAISMIIQGPVIYLMCSERPHWVKAFIGLPSSEGKLLRG